MSGVLFMLFVFATVFVGYAAFKPDSYKVSRYVSVRAPAEKIFPLINDLAAWREWSPYEKLDPLMERHFSDKPVGVGAVYEWSGNSQVGIGAIEITESDPPRRIKMLLELTRPFEANNTAEIVLDHYDGVTKVIWTMLGKRNLLGKVMSIFVPSEKLFGEKFDEGLEKLRSLAEKK